MEVKNFSEKDFVMFVNNGNYSTVKKQLKSGADPNIYDEEGNPLLFLPIINGDDEMLDILLSFETCNINILSHDLRTPLLIAVELNDLEFVKSLVKSGANIDCTDSSGKTPLLLALEEGRFEIAEYLIKKGCNVNAVDGLGQSALQFVANSSHSHCIRMVDKILKNGFNLEDNNEWIPAADVKSRTLGRKTKIPKVMRTFSMRVKNFPSFRKVKPNTPKT
ncbi:ankyrin repeat domain-containing protein 29-like [Ostrea edulis]|uniref:ankyrin repeat domain-containing protein 29-like n=1 Tax=Ostrea edulis TaxID=37623 RepID=UPI0020963E37|nr:ankyrin repeat domain-containing protein 29-like [Ostrea edulis]